MKNIVMIIAPEGFRDEEFFGPKKVFEQNEAKVIVASKRTGIARGKLGATTNVDIKIEDVKAEQFDAIVFVGGPGSSIYFNDNTALDLAKTFYQKGKIISAICIAPSILANAGILKGKKATCFPSEEGNLKAKGAIYTGKDVEKDGKVITANGPMAATKFGKVVLESL